jgi:glycosyltransferase involved in cell wall biosynthesis
LPNAVDPLPGLDSIGPLEHNNRTVLTVTRLSAGDRKKYVDRLIRAMAILKRKGVAANLEIVGDGVLMPELLALCREEQVEDRVRFLGRVGDEELTRSYERAALFALPSAIEGFGIVFLEAWRHGLPVICGSEGAPPEIVTDGINGFVVPPDDVNQVASRIELLLSKPELAKAMGESGRKTVESKYLDHHFKENLETILEGLVR